ncbi:MAG: hypothetical protein IK123_06865 [Lachnospiraceae bacterium]|nr:hypothetical protein [Lachnospiraceae bacterium]
MKKYGMIKRSLAVAVAITALVSAVAFPMNNESKAYAATSASVTFYGSQGGGFGWTPDTAAVEVEEGGYIDLSVTFNWTGDHATLSYGGVTINPGETKVFHLGPITRTGLFDGRDFPIRFTLGAETADYSYDIMVTKLLPAGSKSDEGDEGDGGHECVFEWVTTTEPTEEHDGEEALRCKICGKEIDHNWLSGAAVLIEKIINEIRHAKPGATVTINTNYLTCYPKAVIDELIKRPDVTLVTNYTLDHKRYSMTIPAGKAGTPGVVDDKGYAGFGRLAGIFPTSEIK